MRVFSSFQRKFSSEGDTQLRGLRYLPGPGSGLAPLSRNDSWEGSCTDQASKRTVGLRMVIRQLLPGRDTGGWQVHLVVRRAHLAVVHRRRSASLISRGNRSHSSRSVHRATQHATQTPADGCTPWLHPRWPLPTSSGNSRLSAVASTPREASPDRQPAFDLSSAVPRRREGR